MFKSVVRQQLDALLLVVLESKIVASLGNACTDWIWLQEGKTTETLKKRAPVVLSLLLSDLLVSKEKKMAGQVQSLVDSQLPSTDVLANTVQMRVQQVLPLHL